MVQALALRPGPLVVAVLGQERTGVQHQCLLERPTRRLKLAGPRALATTFAGRPKPLHVQVDGQGGIEAVLAISEQDGLVATTRAAAAPTHRSVA